MLDMFASLNYFKNNNGGIQIKSKAMNPQLIIPAELTQFSRHRAERVL